MVTKEQIIDALKHVYDKSFNRPLVELGLVKDIMPKEARVNLTIVLTEDSEEVKAQYRQDAEEALKRLGAADIHIRYRLITESEHNDISRKLQTEQSGGQAASPKQQQTHAPASGKSTLLDPNSGVTFIAVASGKGGVGKSTVTVNLAAALAREGKRVGIIDADIYGFSVPDMMGIEERPQMADNRIIPVERHGVKVISMGFFVEDNAPIIWRGPMLGKMLRNFFSEVEWGQLDYMVLDLPPGTGDVALDVHQMIPQSKEIVVTTPHATAAFVAARAGSMALRTDHELLGVIENMSYYKDKTGDIAYIFGRGGGAKLAEELHTELLAQIPLGAPENHPSEPDFSPSVYKADSETGELYSSIARRIISKLE
jgi:ATP-binding protein involved in chromosome partitioning